MNRIAKAWLAAAFSLGLAAGASAQTQSQTAPKPQPSAEGAERSMDAAMVAMVPMMERMANIMIEAQLKVAEKPATAERIAAFKKNLYDALLKKGFTAEQAFQMTLATGLPAGAAMGK